MINLAWLKKTSELWNRYANYSSQRYILCPNCSISNIFYNCNVELVYSIIKSMKSKKGIICQFYTFFNWQFPCLTNMEFLTSSALIKEYLTYKWSILIQLRQIIIILQNLADHHLSKQPVSRQSIILLLKKVMRQANITY